MKPRCVKLIMFSDVFGSESVEHERHLSKNAGVLAMHLQLHLTHF